MSEKSDGDIGNTDIGSNPIQHRQMVLEGNVADSLKSEKRQGDKRGGDGSDSTRSAAKKGVIFSLFAILLVGGLIFVWAHFFRAPLHFPALAQGTYHGFLSLRHDKVRHDRVREDGVRKNGESEVEILLFVNRTSQQPSIQTVVFASDWSAHDSGLQEQRSWMWGADYRYAPYKLRAPEGMTATLAGSASAGGASGVVLMEGEPAGEWTLRQIRSAPLTLPQQQAIHRVLDEGQKLVQVQSSLGHAQARVAERRQAIDELAKKLEDADKLRAEVKDQMKAVHNKTEVLEEQQENLRNDLSELERQLDIAQRITRTGKLVTLARETLEREALWLESMMRTHPGGITEQLDEKLQEAEEIVELHREVVAERHAVNVLRGANRFKEDNGYSVPSRPGTFDSLWGTP